MRILILFATLISSLSANAQTKIALRDAISRKLVKAELVSTGGFAQSCLTLTIWNKTKKAITIELLAGEYLEPDDDGEQRLLVGQTVELLATANQKPAQTKVFAFCSQLTKHSPKVGGIFKNKETAPKPIYELANLIDKGKYLSSAAQEAVWCLTDNANVQWIMSDNAAEEKALREYVAAIKGIDLASLPKIKRTPEIVNEIGKQNKKIVLDRDYTDRTGGEIGKKIEEKRKAVRNNTVGAEKTDDTKSEEGKKIKETQKKRDSRDKEAYKKQKEVEKLGFIDINGKLEVDIPSPCILTIEIINPEGKVLKEVYKSNDPVQGRATFPYKYEDYGLPKGDYIIRASGNGRVLKEKTVKL